MHIGLAPQHFRSLLTVSENSCYNLRSSDRIVLVDPSIRTKKTLSWETEHFQLLHQKYGTTFYYISGTKRTLMHLILILHYFLQCAFDHIYMLILHNIYVVVNFLSQVIFMFPLFFGMVMYANEVETKKNIKIT